MSDVPTPRGCPDPLTLASFAEGTIDAEMRREVERHVANCAECPLVIAETMRFLRSDTVDAPAAGELSRPQRWWWLAAAVLALCIPALVWWISTDRDAVVRLRILATDLPERPVEGQLEGFGHAPFSRLRSTEAYGQDTPFRAEAARLAEQEDPGPRELHARGIALLLAHDPRGAVEALSIAVRANSRNADVWNDLSVAYIELATRTDRTYLQPALAASERATSLAPIMASAHFNRGLALEQLGRREDALLEYRRASVLDPRSSWAGEVSQRIALLRQ